MNIVGVDIGGTSIKLGLFDKAGNAKDMITYATNGARGVQYVIKQLMDKIAGLGPIDAIGVSTAGQVHRKTGVLRGSVNIPHLEELPIKEVLQDRFHVPVSVENDVNAAALGESHFGVGRDIDDFLFLTYGTGIGGAIIHKGLLLDGKAGYAGEFGHIVTHTGGHRCNCGLTGCYEMYGSTRALVREAQKVASTYSNGEVIFEAYHKKDVHIQAVVSDWIDEVVVGLISLVHIFNPAAIVIGGGVMEQDMLASKLEKRVNERILPAFRPVRIMQSGLGNRAGMLGAISLHG